MFSCTGIIYSVVHLYFIYEHLILSVSFLFIRPCVIQKPLFLDPINRRKVKVNSVTLGCYMYKLDKKLWSLERWKTPPADKTLNVCMHPCMYAMHVYFDSVVHYTCYVNKFGQIKLIQIHSEPRPTPQSLEDCGWVLKRFPTRVGLTKPTLNDTLLPGIISYCKIWPWFQFPEKISMFGNLDTNLPWQLLSFPCFNFFFFFLQKPA